MNELILMAIFFFFIAVIRAFSYENHIKRTKKETEILRKKWSRVFETTLATYIIYVKESLNPCYGVVGLTFSINGSFNNIHGKLSHGIINGECRLNWKELVKEIRFNKKYLILNEHY